ncbi:MAG: Flp pilus assembly protein CpaB [Actinomycetota bacterium]|nr:Flp pilus assembly protein CpaB [Actinomycetota bacterium]
MTYRLRNIVLAVALAALAALLTSFYVANYKKTVRSDEADVTVYVAAKKIPVGTTGAQAAEGMLKPMEVTRRTVVPGAISNPREIRDLVATETVYEGEQVSVRRFRPVQAAGVRAELKGNLRAVQVNGNANQLLAGTLKKGDRVDLLGTFKVRFQGDQRDHPVTRVVLRDLEVLKAPGGGSAGARLGESRRDGELSVQLAVTDAQAQKLEFTRNVGDWSLALRPVTDPADSPETVETIDRVVCDGLNRRKYAFFCFGRNQ